MSPSNGSIWRYVFLYFAPLFPFDFFFVFRGKGRSIEGASDWNVPTFIHIINIRSSIFSCPTFFHHIFAPMLLSVSLVLAPLHYFQLFLFFSSFSFFSPSLLRIYTSFILLSITNFLFPFFLAFLPPFTYFFLFAACMLSSFFCCPGWNYCKSSYTRAYTCNTDLPNPET